MDAYLEEMLVILPLLGIKAFEKVTDATQAKEVWALRGKDAVATGADTSKGFVVFAGSIARCDEVPSIHSYLSKLRSRLLHEGELVNEAAGLRFAKTHIFDPPSPAAGVVLGRTANGRLEWKESKGGTLKSRQESGPGA